MDGPQLIITRMDSELLRKLEGEGEGKQHGESARLLALKRVLVDGDSVEETAEYFGISERTIFNWMSQYKAGNGVRRMKTKDKSDSKFTEEMKDKIISYYDELPTIYMDEVQVKFRHDFDIDISTAAIHRFLDERGYTRHKLERIAKQRSITEQIRFSEEMRSFKWFPEMLMFLDESGVDPEDCRRTHGYGPKGKSLVFRSEFNRGSRESLLCIIGAGGLLQAYHTEGTFDRLTFFGFLRDFITNSPHVHQYPGPNSVLIMDGASIHRDANIVGWCRLMGIYVIFLPAYCPIYMPIEVFFGWMKRRLKRFYVENSGRKLLDFIGTVLGEFKNCSMLNIFRHCGYTSSGFDMGANDSEIRF
jgi:transposase